MWMAPKLRNNPADILLLGPDPVSHDGQTWGQSGDEAFHNVVNPGQPLKVIGAFAMAVRDDKEHRFPWRMVVHLAHLDRLPDEPCRLDVLRERGRSIAPERSGKLIQRQQ